MNQSKHRRDARAVSKIAGDISQVRRDIAGMMPIEVGGYYLPFTQRLLNPVSISSLLGDYPVIRSVTVLKLLLCSIYVVTPNNGSNYWTIALTSAGGSTMMSLSTATGVTSAVWSRISTETVIAEVTTELMLTLTVTKIGTPGSLYTLPAVYVI